MSNDKLDTLVDNMEKLYENHEKRMKKINMVDKIINWIIIIAVGIFLSWILVMAATH